MVDNWLIVKQDDGLEVDEQYKTPFGVFVPGEKCTLVTPTTLIREPAALKEKWDLMFKAPLLKNAAKVGEKARLAALAFYALLKKSIRDGDTRVISFVRPLSCAVSGRGVTRTSSKSTAVLLDVNCEPITSMLGFLVTRLGGKHTVCFVQYNQFSVSTGRAHF